MNRVLTLGLLVYALILLGLATLNGAVLALVIPLALYLGSGMIFGPQEARLEALRRVEPERCGPNTPVEVRLSVTNQGERLEDVFLQDLLPEGLRLLEGQTSLLTSLAPGERVELAYTVSAARGIYHFSGVHASAGDRLALLQHKVVVPAEGRIFVLPQAVKLKRVAIRPRQTRVYSGVIPARVGGPGVEFYGVRGYQPGDSQRRINWRTSARFEETLFANEYEQERVADVGLVLDARQRSDVAAPHGALFDHSVTAAASLADSLLNDGNRVGLLVYGGFLEWTYPGYGKVQRERIFQSLARARTGDSLIFERLDHLPTRVFPSHSQIILMSPLVTDDLPILIRLRARGYQVMVISPDPIAYEAMNSPRKPSPAFETGLRLARLEREVLVNRLRHAGVHVLSWDVAEPFDQAMIVALSRPSPAQSLGIR